MMNVNASVAAVVFAGLRRLLPTEASAATTNVRVTSATYDASTGELTCSVIPAGPLDIYELILASYVGLGAPVGLVRPGTAAHPALRTIFVDSTNSVFTTTAPFTLAITYDASYHVADIQVVPS